jgi:cyclic pyranopterin phosphate synthase
VSLPRLYLRLSVTDQCNLRCRYCRPARGGPPRTPGLADSELRAIVEALSGVAILEKIRITGGEPLQRRDLERVVSELQRQVPSVELALTTNGVGLETRAAALRAAGLRAVNISLDTNDPAAFARITRGGNVAAVRRGIEAAKTAGIPAVKLNAVLLRSLGAERWLALVRLAARLDCEIRFIELMPYGEGARLFDTEYVDCGTVAGALAQHLTPVGALPPSATARRTLYRVDDRPVTVGWITTVSEPFCASCNRIRLDARGRLYTCLRATSGVDVRPGPEGPEELRQRIAAALAGKDRSPLVWPERSLALLGG